MSLQELWYLEGGRSPASPFLALLWRMIAESGSEKRRCLLLSTLPGTPSAHGMCRGILKMLEPAGIQEWMRLFSMMVLLVPAALECLQDIISRSKTSSAAEDMEAP